MEVKDEHVSTTMEQLSTPIESNPTPFDEEVPRDDERQVHSLITAPDAESLEEWDNEWRFPYHHHSRQ